MPQTRIQKPPPDLSGGLDLFGLWLASRGFAPDSREVHQTCLEKDSSNDSFEVGAINRSPMPLGRWPLRKMKRFLEV
jgi:hypothetical protein